MTDWKKIGTRFIGAAIAWTTAFGIFGTPDNPKNLFKSDKPDLDKIKTEQTGGKPSIIQDAKSDSLKNLHAKTVAYPGTEISGAEVNAVKTNVKSL